MLVHYRGGGGEAGLTLCS